MAVYTELSSELIGEVLDSTYGVGELSFAVGIAEGVENTNYLCATKQADGVEQRYILTVYEQRVDVADLPFFMEYMKHLAASGLECPVPIPTKDGALLTTIKGKHAALISFLTGKSRTAVKNHHVAALGAAAAKLHVAGQSFSMSRPNSMAHASWRALYDSVAGQLDHVQKGLGSLVAAELDWLDAHWPTDLPAGVIHADLFPDNVFFEQGEISGIIDFYFACNDMFAYELAIVMNAWCFEFGGEFNLTKAQLLLKHYQRVRPLTEKEVAALIVLCRGAALRFLLTRAYDAINTPEGALVKVKDPMEYVKKLEFHQQVKHQRELGL